jgi:division/cell wall cluster transcriptional repressor MraZ
METLSGTFEVKVDERGRVAIPARLLEALAAQMGEKPEEIIVGLGLSPNLCVFTPKAYAAMLDEVNRRIEQEKAEATARMRWTKIRKQIVESQDVQQLDKQNRIRIPSLLARQYKLSGEIVVQGSYDHLELVNMADYEQALSSFRETMTELMD